MRRAALLSALAIVAAPIAAAAQTSGPIMVSDAWSRPAVQGTTAAGFLTVMNHGKAPAALLKVDSPLSKKVEIHRSAMTNGVMSMSPQQKVDVPPGGMVTFAPGGYHLMFYSVSRTLKGGDRLPATLTFTGGRRIKVDFIVGAGAPGEMDHGTMDHGHMGH